MSPRPYVGSSAGAPPPPPPGGYRGARRVPPASPDVSAEPVARPRSTVLSWLALAAAVLFALVLLVLWAAGSTPAIYSVGALAAQLVVAIVVVASLVNARGRKVGGIALAIVVLINIGTIGAASAIARHPTPESVITDPEEAFWAAHPGIQGQSTSEILARPSLEDVQVLGDELLAAIRQRLTADFGVEWVAGVPGGIRNERNGYGGESMLVQYTSGTWATTTPVTDYQQKLAMMAAIEEVLAEYDWWYFVAFNDPSSGFDLDYIERLYGGTDPRTQPEWEWYADNYPDPMRLYANITDLAHDDGSFRAAREARVAGTSEPIEGLRIVIHVREVLSEADVDEFLERMKEYDNPFGV